DQREPNNHRRIQCCLIDTRGERNCGRQLGCLIPLCRHSRFHQTTMAPWDGCLTSSGSARCMSSEWLAPPTASHARIDGSGCCFIPRGTQNGESTHRDEKRSRETKRRNTGTSAFTPHDL